MTVTILTDNKPSPDMPFLGYEHGFSAYIESGGKGIICDTGASGLFAENAAKLGLDLNRTSFVFLSHGHNDHTGGLSRILEETAADIYMSDKIFGRKFFSSRHGGKVDISMPLCEEECDGVVKGAMDSGRWHFIGKSGWIGSDVAAVCTREFAFALPFGNSFLSVRERGNRTVGAWSSVLSPERKDDFAHELALVFKTDEGIVIISPCSHCGAINIIGSCREFTGESRVRAFIGGLHFVDSEHTEEEARRFIGDLAEVAPEAEVFTGHCTCDKAKAVLNAAERIRFFHTGTVISLG